MKYTFKRAGALHTIEYHIKVIYNHKILFVLYILTSIDFLIAVCV